ncbi:toprim domain-containing protein [Micromonospora sp. CPCC 206061]|uniref:toprim domain-containing protein n=1 Tax=Micromonospora sp. CPCC 206061 TaxID=3122410 RepID=UPI002FF2D3A2
MNRSALLFYRAQLVPGGPAETYVRHRLGALPRGWSLGYAPREGRGVVAYLGRRGFTPADVVAAGLARRTRGGRHVDRFRGRIMFPVRDVAGEPVGFLARACPPHASRGPKYINTPATAAYTKSELLYGLAEQRRILAGGARPVIVEGPLDVLAVGLADEGRGELAGVAACGTAFTAAHLAALSAAAHLDEGMVTALDADAAGRRATARVWRLLRPHRGWTAAARAAALPPGGDPAAVLRGGGVQALRRALLDQSRPLLDAVVDAVLDDAGYGDVASVDLETRFALLRRVAPVVVATGLAEDMVRLVVHLAGRLDLMHSTVTGAVCDALTSPPGTHEQATRAGYPQPSRPSTGDARNVVSEAKEPVQWLT